MKQLIRRLTEPAVSIPDERKLFSDHALKLLILPLFLEQLLEVLVGVSDTFMVSYAGRLRFRVSLSSICSIQYLSSCSRRWLQGAPWW